jgi:hypothetical protein
MGEQDLCDCEGDISDMIIGAIARFLGRLYRLIFLRNRKFQPGKIRLDEHYLKAAKEVDRLYPAGDSITPFQMKDGSWWQTDSQSVQHLNGVTGSVRRIG